MRVNKIVYDNLRAEMGRKNIGLVDIAKAIDMNRDTLARKLSRRSPLYLDEAFLMPTLSLRVKGGNGYADQKGRDYPQH